MMNLEERLPGSIHTVKHSLSDSQSRHLICRSNRLTVAPSVPAADGVEELGRVVYGPGGAKLEAVKTLHILPGHSDASATSPVTTDPHSDKYVLEPVFGGRREIILLRHGDMITSPGSYGSVMCVWQASEVQVNSSAAELAQAEPSEAKNGVDETSEDETEDDAVSDDTTTEVPVTQPVTQPTKSQPSATPHLTTHRSVLVQETPTTQRMLGVNEYGVLPSEEDRRVEPTPPPQEPIAVSDTFSTARTGQSPKTIAHDSIHAEPVADRKRPQSSPEVRVSGRRSNKRSSPDASPNSKAEPFVEGRSVKRAKNATSIKDEGDDSVQASPLDNINADPTRTTYSGKSRKQSANIPETTPSKLSRSWQRSATATTAVAYEGEPPRVATSNSAIKDGSSAVKFLRKHGGTLVSTVEDKCNVLCVRDGGLAKTMKVIQAIALGVPVVTDKWLSDSAKAECFLDLSSYKPSVAQQEKEWGFNLEKVWGVAQTPFKGYAIYFTPTLKKTYTNFREMDRVCQTVGAKVIAKRTSKNDRMIVLATGEDDLDAEKMVEDGETCYHKDLLTTSILRGTLDLDSDEFKVKAKHAGPPRRKGPRKST